MARRAAAATVSLAMLCTATGFVLADPASAAAVPFSQDRVAWATRVGGLQYHPVDGPDAGGKMIHATPNSDEYLVAGNWDGNGTGGGACAASNSCTPTSFANVCPTPVSGHR